MNYDRKEKALLRRVDDRNSLLSQARPNTVHRAELLLCRRLLAKLLVAWDRTGVVTMSLSGDPTASEDARNYLRGRRSTSETKP